jgi:hypothetical protein
MSSRLPKAQRDALVFLRRADVPGADDAISALQVPWSSLVGRKLRNVLRLSDQGLPLTELAARLAKLVQDEGLLGPAGVEMPPAIELEDIVLICYQVVTP